MRAIETIKSRELRQKRNKTIIVIVMIIIMVGSSAGYAISLFWESSSDNEKIEEGEPIFNGNVWVFKRDGKTFGLINSFDDVRNISVYLTDSVVNFKDGSVYIAADEDFVIEEIVGVLGQYNRRIQKACYGPCDNPELPEKDCSSNLIVWKNSENKRVYQEENCVFIEGGIESVDAFLYKFLGF